MNFCMYMNSKARRPCDCLELREKWIRSYKNSHLDSPLTLSFEDFEDSSWTLLGSEYCQRLKFYLCLGRFVLVGVPPVTSLPVFTQPATYGPAPVSFSRRESFSPQGQTLLQGFTSRPGIATRAQCWQLTDCMLLWHEKCRGLFAEEMIICSCLFQ